MMAGSARARLLREVVLSAVVQDEGITSSFAGGPILVRFGVHFGVLRRPRGPPAPIQPSEE